MMNKIIYGFLVLSIFCSSCSKGSPVVTTIALAPSNLIISALVDSTGSVNVKATALNAVSYDIDFGNGVIQTVPSGVVKYKYPAAGTYTINIVAKSVSGQIVSANTNVTVAIKLSLFWSEEFNTDGAPDPAKWGYDTGNGSGGWGNSEQEFYTTRPQNVIVSNGTLKITALKENYNSFNYTSARLLSQNKFAFTYGKVEFRAKLPTGLGPWPALWLLGSNINTISWPACGEIDVMEQNGGNSNKIYGTLHYPGHSGGNANGASVLISNPSEFHLYSLDWTSAAIKISVDGQVYQTVVNSGSLPFNHDFFLILNMAMGGTFGGSIDPAFTKATMEVDYIRIYK